MMNDIDGGGLIHSWNMGGPDDDSRGIKLELNEETRSDRKKWKWTPRNIARSKDIQKEINLLEDYWPLTERQIFYRLISSKNIQAPHWLYAGRPVNYYAALGRMLKWMRIDDHIERDVIIDEHRVVTEKLGYSNAEAFINSELCDLARGYSRCNAQKQERHVEVWIEKATLLHIVEPVADEFCRRVVVGKGYQSITFQTEFYDRATEAINKGMIPTVLYFGDFDPSGVNMIYAAMQTLTDELDLYGVEYWRSGLNPSHFKMLNAVPVPVKASDKRTERFVKKYGTTAYELDALHPEQLKNLVRKALVSFTNMNNYRENIKKGKIDREHIFLWRSRMIKHGRQLAVELGI